jgi:hypothetical protein
MAQPEVDVGTGATILFGTSGFSAEIEDITPPGMTRGSIQTSHQTTTAAHTHQPLDLYEPGELSFDVHFNPDDIPPMTATAETVTLKFSGGNWWSFSAFMTGYEPSHPFEDKMMATVTCKVSGRITSDADGSGSGTGSAI